MCVSCSARQPEDRADIVGGMAPGVHIRPAIPADLPTFLSLVDALADYEKLDRPNTEARARLEADALTGRFSLLLGVLDGSVVGYAVHFPTYSTFRALPSLYLEDLFVLPHVRGKGVGIALFRAVAAEAARQGCGRMEWQVLSWNEPSIQFYERLGARHLDGWLPFRLDGDALATVGS
jgi:GNAT superfamily N-acetyltransferase